MENLTKAISRLLQLNFLPAYGGKYSEADLVDRAEKFMSMHSALKQVSFDCVMAISKISMHLKRAIYAESSVV